MKIPRLKIGDLCVVTWIDAYGESHLAWIDEDEIDLKGEYLVFSCGFYVETTKDYLIVAGDVGAGGAYGRVFRIPLGCVKKVKKQWVVNGKVVVGRKCKYCEKVK